MIKCARSDCCCCVLFQAWYDMQSTVGTVSNLLIRNVDLRVLHDKSGNQWHGNGVEKDKLHPQEQVFIESPSECLFVCRSARSVYVTSLCVHSSGACAGTGLYRVFVSTSGSMSAIYTAIVISCGG
jgi:hypothetical protein